MKNAMRSGLVSRHKRRAAYGEGRGEDALSMRQRVAGLSVGIWAGLFLFVVFRSVSPALLEAQTAPATYQKKYAADPARSDSESAALGYMRVVIGAQRKFNKQYGHFATSLGELVHSGNFTKRMVNPERGDYTAKFKGKADSFSLSMTPQHPDADHRYFYAEDDGKIRAEEDKAANADSPLAR